MQEWMNYTYNEETPCCGINFLEGLWEVKGVPDKEATEKAGRSFLAITGGRQEVYDEDDKPFYKGEEWGVITALRRAGFKPLTKFESRTTKRMLTLWFKH